MQNWRMNAVLNTDINKYAENWDKIFKNAVSSTKKQSKEPGELSTMADSDLPGGRIHKENTKQSSVNGKRVGNG